MRDRGRGRDRSRQRHRPRRGGRRGRRVRRGLAASSATARPMFEIGGHRPPGLSAGAASAGPCSRRTCAAPPNGPPHEPADAPILVEGVRRGHRDRASGAPDRGRLRARPPLLPDAAPRPRPHPGRAAPRRPRAAAGHAGPAPRDLRRRGRGVPRPLGPPRAGRRRVPARCTPGPSSTPALWVVAWDGDEVAGVVQTWIWPEENERLGVKRGWLEHISVRRPWRRRGLGRALTAESLRRLRDAGMDDAMLGVDSENPTGALGLYEGLGFERPLARRRVPAVELER